MKETTPAAMPPCFDRWCKKFDDLLKTKAQKREFRHYLGGLLGESERKNIYQMASNSVGVTYHKLHHFLTEATWSADKINERRLEVLNKCNQTRISRGFSLIVDDSGHRKSGNFTAGVGRQYIGEIGKTDNGNVVVTTHLYDGKKSLPLDIELYQHATSLAEGKKDPEFKKKPTLAGELIDKSLNRGYRPGIVLIDSSYGNNTSFLKDLEEKKLKYIGGIAKNRNILIKDKSGFSEPIRIDEYAQWISSDEFKEIQIPGEKPRTVWVAILSAEISQLKGQRKIAIVTDISRGRGSLAPRVLMNAPVFEDAEDIDYLITNVEGEIVTEQWIVDTYSERNWVEVFYREAKGWLGLKEYQVREKKSNERHFILVFCAYTFILWHKLTGGLRRRWANKPLKTFPEALEAFRTAISYRFVEWLNHNRDVFIAYKASLGFVWA